MKTTVTITSDRFPEIIAKLPELANAAVRKSAEDIAAAARTAAPVDSGDLLDSIEARQESKTAWVVEAKEFYAPFIEYGTPPHVVGGLYAGAKHPGTPPRPFMTPAAEAERPDFMAAIQELINEL